MSAYGVEGARATLQRSEPGTIESSQKFWAATRRAVAGMQSTSCGSPRASTTSRTACSASCAPNTTHAPSPITHTDDKRGPGTRWFPALAVCANWARWEQRSSVPLGYQHLLEGVESLLRNQRASRSMRTVRRIGARRRRRGHAKSAGQIATADEPLPFTRMSTSRTRAVRARHTTRTRSAGVSS